MKIEIMKNYSIVLLLMIVGLYDSYGQGNSLFDDSYMHEIRVTFEDADFWGLLSEDYNQNYPDVPYQMAKVEIDGEEIDSIGIRQKGFSSHFIVQGVKKSLKIDFNEFVSGKEYKGLRKINLNNGVGDPAMQRDKISYDILNRAGVSAPRTSYARLYLNDEYWGLYMIVEQIDKSFLNRNFESSEGTLFKNIGFSSLDWLGADTMAYQEMFEIKTGYNENAWEDFLELMRVLNLTNDTEFSEQIKTVFDADLYLKVLAVDVATGNWDSYLDHGRNFYLYQDPTSNKFSWIPWDYNFAMGGNFSFDFFGTGNVNSPETCGSIIDGSSPYESTDSIFNEVINIDESCCTLTWDESCQGIYNDIESGGDGFGDGPVSIFSVDMSSSEKVLIERLMEIPEYREQYYAEFCNLLENNFTTDRILPLIEKYGNLIRADIETDPNYIWTLNNFEADLDKGTVVVPGLKRFIESQTETLSGELNNLYDCADALSSLSTLDVSINEFLASNDSLSGIADSAGEYDDYIELYNNTDQEIDLSNSYLTDDEDLPQKWNFPEGTMIGANDFLIVWADNDAEQEGLHCNFKLSKGGEFIMLTDASLVLDSISFGEQETNVSYSRVPNGTGDFVSQEPTFNANNSTVSVTDEQESKVKVYPNPSTNYINIEFEASSATRITEMYNGLGQLMIQDKLDQANNKVLISKLNAGIYFLTIRDGANVITTQKITIIK